MSRVVLDCSVAISWLFKDETSDAADRLLDNMDNLAAVVPQHWILEMTNAILNAERRGRMTEGEADELLGRIVRFGVEIDSKSLIEACASSMGLARKHKLTIYDAVYLELAVRFDAALATLDDELANAAVRENVQLALKSTLPPGSP